MNPKKPKKEKADMGKKKEPAIVEEDLDAALAAIVDEETEETEKAETPAKEFKSRPKHSTPKDETEELGNVPVTEMEVSKIKIPKEKLRIVPDEEIDELADSIRSEGLLQAIVVGTDGVLVAGYRRLQAHKKLNLKTISVKIIEAEGTERYRIAGIENIQRKDLSLEEKAKYYQTLLENKKDFPTRKAVAEAVGVPESCVSAALNAVGDCGRNFSPEVKEKREAKKAAQKKEAQHKFYKIDPQNLPENIVGLVSKDKISLHLTWEVGGKHLATFDIKKELAKVEKELDAKKFRTEATILRKNA